MLVSGWRGGKGMEGGGRGAWAMRKENRMVEMKKENEMGETQMLG